jgi:hypothetical protein
MGAGNPGQVTAMWPSLPNLDHNEFTGMTKKKRSLTPPGSGKAPGRELAWIMKW